MDIPVVHCYGTNAAAELRKACTEVGFFYLADHRIPQSLLDSLYAEMRTFFSKPESVKRQVLADENMRGYTPMNEETLDPAVQTQGDTKEGYYICREALPDEVHLPLHGSNVFPKDNPTFREVTVRYFDLMCELGYYVAQLFADAAGAPGAFAAGGMFDRPMAALRLLHYNNVVSNVDDGVFGAGAHTDYGLLTLLSTDENPGLEIYYNQEWIPVPPKPHCFVVNIGDLGERWTNGTFKSTRHRVVRRRHVDECC
ncbi:hypothetical protein, variant [Aphanomyces invadans]|uniref:Fe2OG dioxygenase domain-containing protein n=1 Tax=Aphanomyces invadans TaxID=157072 RepID=A0A024ULK5_9STRA|nr:hypothetical protein, variant [Aphanomyces invadans]ETW06478.1 hypothetical protein, variant [Aphanomyces invadans]|eukprot:XP_008864553.1 hypothetical protein, variant [Aphanomyces invadans]